MKKFRFYWDSRSEPQLKIDVPGFKKDEIKVHLTASSMSVSASKKAHREEKNKNFYRAEAFASSFSRFMSLPNGINPGDLEVEIRDGSVVLKRKKKKEVKV